MPELIPGYTTEQKFLTVTNNDTDLNAAIAAQAVDLWIVGSFILSNSEFDVIILFTRTIPTVAP